MPSHADLVGRIKAVEADLAALKAAGPTLAGPPRSGFFQSDEVRAFFGVALSVYQGKLAGDPAGGTLEPARRPAHSVVSAWAAALEALELFRTGGVERAIANRERAMAQIESERAKPPAGTGRDESKPVPKAHGPSIPAHLDPERVGL